MRIFSGKNNNIENENKKYKLSIEVLGIKPLGSSSYLFIYLFIYVYNEWALTFINITIITTINGAVFRSRNSSSITKILIVTKMDKLKQT